jgi:hypothetical protein
MKQTHVLIDFENRQPPAADLRRLDATRHRVWIFRGPQQKKFDADMIDVLQPLGDRVQHVPSARAGRNALDFLLAYHLGRLVEAHEREYPSAEDGGSFVVLSRDTGFDSLIEHIRARGHEAARVATLRDVLPAGPATPARVGGASTASRGRRGAAALDREPPDRDDPAEPPAPVVGAARPAKSSRATPAGRAAPAAKTAPAGKVAPAARTTSAGRSTAGRRMASTGRAASTGHAASAGRAAPTSRASAAQDDAEHEVDAHEVDERDRAAHARDPHDRDAQAPLTRRTPNAPATRGRARLKVPALLSQSPAGLMSARPASPPAAAWRAEDFDAPARSAPGPAASARPAPAPRPAARKAAKKAAKKAAAPEPAAVGPGDVDRVVEHFRTHERSRPARRKALERDIESLLGRGLAAGVVHDIVEALELRGVIAIVDNKVSYNDAPRGRRA